MYTVTTQDELISSQSRKCSQARTLSSITIHYAAGYVIRKLLNSFKNQENMMAVLML